MSFWMTAEEHDRIYGSTPQVQTEIVEDRRIVASSPVIPPSRYAWQTGDKWSGSFGATDLLIADYWTLRARSVQLFETNLYARGLIRRLITNEINTGLHLEATPEERILGIKEDSLGDWTEDVETRFELWGKDPFLCDHDESRTFGALQAAVRMESLIAGDVLAVLVQDQRTRLPRIQLVSGALIETPLRPNVRRGHEIRHGVELDSQGRHVAYWVRQKNLKDSKRIPAWGEKSGRRLAWLVYGTDRRLDETRGRPLLSLILQSLKEIDRYRDSVQRKATINAILAGFIQKDQPTMGVKPLTSGAVRVGTNQTVDTTGAARSFRVAEHHPGVYIEDLQAGEKMTAMNSQGTDERFGEFEEAIVQAIAWANEIPPEILRLSFSSNYSASQAATNEFKMYLNKVRTEFGATFCQPVYVEWLIAQAMSDRVQAPGLVDSWNDVSRFEEFAAWCSADWSGQIKPAIDGVKIVKAEEMKCEGGFTSRDRASRELTGTKYSRNIKKLKRENELLAEAMQPLIEARQALKAASSTAGSGPPAGTGETQEPVEDWERFTIREDDPPLRVVDGRR